MKLFWQPSSTPPVLTTALRVLAADYPLHEGTGERQLLFAPGGTTATQLRAVSAVLADLLAEGATQRDYAALMAVGKDALALAESFESLEASWRRAWMRRNKPQGQIRLAQQAIRHRELARRVDELLRGQVAAIPELDERPREARGLGGSWRFLASGSASV